MTQRLTAKDAEACFKRLCTLLGKHPAKHTVNGDGRWIADVGGWILDHNSVYGGYVVAEIVNEAGGESRPLGDGRVGPREFCERVWFVERALETQDEEARERACPWEHVI